MIGEESPVSQSRRVPTRPVTSSQMFPWNTRARVCLVLGYTSCLLPHRTVLLVTWRMLALPASLGRRTELDRTPPAMENGTR